MDKTGLFWKATPDTILATETLSGTKKQKVRVSLANYFNIDSSDKLPLWIIGALIKPYCFAAACVNINSLNML